MLIIYKMREIVIKKSRFLAYSFSLEDKNQIDFYLNNLKKEHKKAIHFVYAYKADNGAGFSDDGEPKNSAGKPLFRIIELKNLTNILIVVVRYWGGSKLGIGPLTRAYTKAAAALFN